MTRYDLIGDIHGYADELKALLKKLDYQNHAGCYRHPDRKAVFVGDFIDRGPQQREVLDTVMAMVNQGTALAVMGNHEFNALAFHREAPDYPGRWLRPRHNKNILQHMAFLQAYGPVDKKPELNQALSFFRSLPLWLELEGLRVVHACWHQPSMTILQDQLNPDNTLTDDLLIQTNRQGSDEFKAMETLLKGMEIPLPTSCFFLDKDGNKRTNVRIRWWLDQADTFADLALTGPVRDSSGIENLPVKPDDLFGYKSTEPPVFFGHYWLTGQPAPQMTNVACLDYSVAGDGKLVAYRWDGEPVLNDDKFVFVQAGTV